MSAAMTGIFAIIQEVHKAKKSVQEEEELTRTHSLARVSPLVASVIAPFTTLYDIPALTQHWYALDGVTVFDYKASIILSAVGLFVNILAEIFLVVRFSASTQSWKIATRISLLLWLLKTALAVTNLVIFGLYSRNDTGYSYQEGFWCAVASCILAGIIAGMLLFHYFVEVWKKDEDDVELRIAGRRFILSLLALVSILAVQGLVCMAALRNRLYFDGIYFSVVTMTTIGFGDLLASHTSTKILLFPFAVIGIAALANQVALVCIFLGESHKNKAQIIGFFSARSKAQSNRLWARYRQMQNERKANVDNEDIEKEIDFQMNLARVEARWQETADFAIAIGTLLIFWVVGAVVFATIEGWTVGNGLYFAYVTFLSCGFGDFSPKSPGGRVFFVLWAVQVNFTVEFPADSNRMAVPVVAAFAVQSISAVIGTIAASNLFKGKNARNTTLDRRKQLSHSKLVMQHQNTLSATVCRSPTSKSPVDTSRISAPILSLSGIVSEEPVDMDDGLSESVTVDRALLKHFVQVACEMEAMARHLIIENLPVKAHATLLLKADKVMQARHIRDLKLEDGAFHFVDGFGLVENGPSQFARRSVRASAAKSISLSAEDEQTLLNQVNGYRSSFAALLACSSRVLDPDGADKWDSDNLASISKKTGNLEIQEKATELEV